MYRIFADSYPEVLREIAAFVKRAADAERHHALVLYKGKKIETEKAEHCARALDHMAETIGQEMEVVPERAVDGLNGR